MVVGVRILVVPRNRRCSEFGCLRREISIRFVFTIPEPVLLLQRRRVASLVAVVIQSQLQGGHEKGERVKPGESMMAAWI